MAGGHSIDSPEPIFGLAVNGLVPLAHLKQNSTATPGSLLYLTKPLGVGVLTTAEKNGSLRDEHRGLATASMTRINSIGAALAPIDGVCAMTDVTGFGLLGHLLEMCDGSAVSAEINLSRVPLLTNLDFYLERRSTPGGTKRNWMSYGEGLHLDATNDHRSLAELFDAHYQTLAVLCDPQTSGGLLVAVHESAAPAVEQCMRDHGLHAQASPIGRIIEQQPFGVRLV